MVPTPEELRLREMGRCHVHCRTLEKFIAVARERLGAQHALRTRTCLSCNRSASDKESRPDFEHCGFVHHGVCDSCVTGLRQKYRPDMPPLYSSLSSEDVQLAAYYVNLAEWMQQSTMRQQAQGYYTTLETETYINGVIDSHHSTLPARCSDPQKLEVTLPATLEKLTFGLKFNQTLQGVTFPESLTSLVLGAHFDQSCLAAQREQLFGWRQLAVQAAELGLGGTFQPTVAGPVTPWWAKPRRLWGEGARGSHDITTEVRRDLELFDLDLFDVKEMGSLGISATSLIRLFSTLDRHHRSGHQ
eukprot:Skav222157  [mRNA]  locus=scaffold294:49210:53306:- [translate_table: standard]